ncbi:coiled-coil domain-containing protein 134 [Halictus rubicundus]|uniref:coiled-coil domain-containing protein 134 n=1 Tax=Halictus rubicundus TaxID=77578 RepID=UPI0040364100
MPRVFVYIAVVSVLTCNAHAQQADLIATDQPINNEAGNGESTVYEELFRKSFSLQREEHASAIKRLERIDNYELLYKMIMVLGEKMIDVIESSKSLIEDGDFNPDDRLLPRNVTVQSALSTVLENTALFGDIILHFPEVTQRILKAQPKWNTILTWSLKFTNRSRHLVDEKTIDLINLVTQELNITDRQPEYFNPYRRSVESRMENKGTTKTKKEKRKRGPQMTNIEL